MYSEGTRPVERAESIGGSGQISSFVLRLHTSVERQWWPALVHHVHVGAVQCFSDVCRYEAGIIITWLELDMKLRNLFLLIALSLPVCLSAQTSKQIYLQRADSLLQQILTLYKVEKYGLLTETYPRNPEQRITYTANTGVVVNQQEVSYLWL